MASVADERTAILILRFAVMRSELPRACKGSSSFARAFRASRVAEFETALPNHDSSRLVLRVWPIL